MLEAIEVRFQVPDLTAVEEKHGNGNVVNVVAGVNGTGKTSFLEGIFYVFLHFSGLPAPGLSRDFFDKNLTVINNEIGLGEDGKVILIDSRQNFRYESKLKLPLGPFVKVDSEILIEKAIN